VSTMTEQTTKVFQIYIRTAPERIWEAITDPDFTARYFYGGRVDSTFEPGAQIVYRAAERDGLDAEGEVLESDPPRRLVYTWRSLWTPELAAERASRVTWQIEPEADAQGVCRVTLTHDGLAESPKTAAVIDGWSFVLSGMKTLLETGEPLTR
jgi:uncharacterized protein YndB with AHSA1/START domain